MQSNITTDGKLPPNFISLKGEFISLYSYGKDNPNWQPVWVQPSQFCPGGSVSLTVDKVSLAARRALIAELMDGCMDPGVNLSEVIVA
jgi:hypothetical protein